MDIRRAVATRMRVQSTVSARPTHPTSARALPTGPEQHGGDAAGGQERGVRPVAQARDRGRASADLVGAHQGAHDGGVRVGLQDRAAQQRPGLGDQRRIRGAAPVEHVDHQLGGARPSARTQSRTTPAIRGLPRCARQEAGVDRVDGHPPYGATADHVRDWPAATLVTTEGLGHYRLLGDPVVATAVAGHLAAGAGVPTAR